MTSIFKIFDWSKGSTSAIFFVQNRYHRSTNEKFPSKSENSRVVCRLAFISLFFLCPWILLCLTSNARSISCGSRLDTASLVLYSHFCRNTHPNSTIFLVSVSLATSRCHASCLLVFHLLPNVFYSFIQ